MLAVKRKNNLVHVVEMQRMGQSNNETITQFATRLRGQAKVCDLTVECPQCQRDVSYGEQAIMYQFIHGLNNFKAQERILEASAQVEGGELSLVRVLKLAEAFKMGRENQKVVNKGGQVSKLSEYQAKKITGRQENRQTNATKKDDKKCGNCGKSGHRQSSMTDDKTAPRSIKHAASAKSMVTLGINVAEGPATPETSRRPAKKTLNLK